ncbi:DUF2726 domain-containing protein [Sphingomonas gei]|nr:DUF2726 domain-containing protein [Sphingomonas gei]
MSLRFDQLGHLPHDSLVLATGACILIGVAIWIASRVPIRTHIGRAPSPVARPFLSNRKHAMLAALERVLPMYRIHAQVSLSALVEPAVGQGHPQTAEHDPFLQTIVDFVIVDPASSSVIALIEMDDRFADPELGNERHEIASAAGYQTIRISASDRATIATAQAAVGHLRDAALKAAPAVTRLPVPVRTWPLGGRFNGTR